MTPIIRKIIELKAGYERFFGGPATIVELSSDLHDALKMEVEPYLTHQVDPSSDGKTRILSLEVVEVSGTNHMEIK